MQIRRWGRVSPMAMVAMLIVAVGLLSVVSVLMREERSVAVEVAKVEPRAAKVEAPPVAPTPVPVAAATPFVPAVKVAVVEPAFSVSGVVRDAATQGAVAGAIVRILRGGFEGGFPMEETEAESSSDELGGYTISLEKLFNSRSVVVAVEADGYAMHRVSIQLEQGVSKHSYDALLERAGPISGRVVDEEGVGISDASIRWHQGGSVGWVEAPQRRLYYDLDIRSGEDGAFVLANVLDGMEVGISAYKVGFLPAMMQSVRGGTEGVVVVMSRGKASIRGQVVDHTGKPAKDVMAFVSGLALAEYGYFLPGVAVDDEGRFEFSTLPVGDLTVSVSAGDRHIQGMELAKKDVKLIEGDDLDVVLQVPEAVSISGRAYDVDTGAGVAGVQIQSTRRIGTDPPAIFATSDIDGTFRLSHLNHLGGGSRMQFVPPLGYAPAPDKHRNLFLNLGDAAPGKEHPVEIALKRSVNVAGRVMRGDEPEPGAKVTIRGSGFNFGASVESGADGRFQVSAAPGSVLDFETITDWGRAAASTEVPVGAVAPEVLLNLIEMASISGRITLNGEPVQGVQVRFSITKNESTGSVIQGLGSVRSDGNGVYQFEELPEGIVTVKVEMPSSREVNLPKFMAPEALLVEVAAGEKKTGVDFALNSGKSLSGVVVDMEGKPLEGVSVIFEQVDLNNSRGVAKVPTKADGSFLLEGLDDSLPGAYMLSTYIEGYHGYREPIEFEDAPFRVTLKALPVITMRVYTESVNNPVKSFQYRVMTGFDERYKPSFIPVMNELGEVRFRMPAPNLNIEVQRLDFDGKETGSIEKLKYQWSSATEAEPILVNLGAMKAPLRGRVVYTDGPPVAGARVAIVLRKHGHYENPLTSSFPLAIARSGENGEFVLNDIPLPGEYHIAAADSSELSQGLYQRFEAGKDPEFVEIAILRYVTLKGTATGIPKEDLKTAVYTLSNAGNPVPVQSGNVSFDGSGGFVIEKAPKGTYRIRLTLPDGRSGICEQAYGGTTNLVNFSEKVNVSGRIFIHGEPWSGNLTLMLGMNPMRQLTYKSGGGYTELLTPGFYPVYVKHPKGLQTRRTRQTLQIPADVEEHVEDIRIDFADISVVVFVEGRETVTSGSVWLDLQEGGVSGDSISGQLTENGSFLFEGLPTGVYKARYSNQADYLIGESEPVEIRVGGENVIRVQAVSNRHLKE